MKTVTFKNNWLTATGLLLVMPTAYFILIGVLSEFGINGPLEAIQPLAAWFEYHLSNSLWANDRFFAYDFSISKT